MVGDSLSSGDGMQINSSAAHTGQLISLSSTNTGDTARGEALFVQYSTANTTAKAVRFANTSADIFSIEQSEQPEQPEQLQHAEHAEHAKTCKTCQTCVPCMPCIPY